MARGRKYKDLPFAPGVLVHLLLIWPREIGAGAFQTHAVGREGVERWNKGQIEIEAQQLSAPFALSFAWPLLGPIGLFPVSMGWGLALQPTPGN